MKRMIIPIAIASLVTSLGTTAALAGEEIQPPRISAYYLTQAIARYDPATVETISGEVVSIVKISSQRGQGYGVHLLLKNEAETIEVHLAPEWYLDGQNFSLQVGDRLEIKGSRVTYETKPIIIAAEVTQGDQVLRLRNDNGVPLWSRRQR